MKPITAAVKQKGGARTYPANQEVTLNSDGSGGPILYRPPTKCWKGYERVPGTKKLTQGSCKKKKK